MKMLPKSLLMVVAVSIFAGSAMADANAPAGGKDVKAREARAAQGQDRMAALTKRLNLTAEQQEKIKPILADEMSQMEALKKDQSLTKEQRMEKMKEIRKTTNDKIMPILTPEQQEKMKRPAGREGAGGQQKGRERHKPADANSRK